MTTGGDDLVPPEPILATPVPLVVDTRRDGRDWLLRSSGRNIALTLDCLRRLRGIAGVKEVRLNAGLPAPLEQKQRFRASG